MKTEHRKTFKITCIISVTFLFTAFMCRFTIPKLQLDGYTGLLLRILLNTDDTIYTKDYTDENFLLLKTGMPKEEVLRLLGKPFAEFDRAKNTISMQYSKSPHDTHYRARAVLLQDNKVINIISYYYVD